MTMNPTEKTSMAVTASNPIKYAIACGIGPPLKVLQNRAKDLHKLLSHHEPLDVLADVAVYREDNPDARIERVHFFP